MEIIQLLVAGTGIEELQRRQGGSGCLLLPLWLGERQRSKESLARGLHTTGPGLVPYLPTVADFHTP